MEHGTNISKVNKSTYIIYRTFEDDKMSAPIAHPF